MYKRLLAIFIVLMFLITSVSVISAVDDSNSIDVKVVWRGDLSNQPDSVQVNLIKDGKIVDTAKLSQSNSWKTTFHVSDDDDYQVKLVDSKDYSSKVSGNEKEGFVITITLDENVLSAADDETQLEDAQDDVVSDDSGDAQPSDQQPTSQQGNDAGTSDNADNNDNNNTGEDTNNSTNNDTDTNATSDDTDDDSDDSDDDSEDDSDDEKTTTTTTTKTTTKVVKHDKKKPVNTTKTKKNNTGLPVAVLVVAVFAAAFVPFSRKK